MSRVPAAKLGGIFKRMETDAEYVARLLSRGWAAPPAAKGADLDQWGDARKIQRRIVESSAD